MRVVSAVETFPGSVHEAETVWYETGRWPEWVDGLDRVLTVDGRWPEGGASVTWESGPAGRGRVVEQVVAHEALAGQTVEVQDETMRGHQTVAFTPEEEDGVSVTLRLEYELKRRSIVTPLIDSLFIKRAFANSVQTTLRRFGAELAAAREARVG